MLHNFKNALPLVRNIVLKSYYVMRFPFGNKKDDALHNDQENKSKRSLDDLEDDDITKLGKDEMNKLGGGRDTSKPLSGFPDLRDSLGSTIPL